MPNTEQAHIQQATEYLRARIGITPRAGLILGTGLSGLSTAIRSSVNIPYADIPHFPRSTVQSHKGELIAGTLSGVPVLAMAGRFHYYEGYSMKEVTFPIRVLKSLGIELLVVSNAAGGASERVAEGDLAVIEDHLNLFPENPLRGPNLNDFGPRFPDMVDAYDPSLMELAVRLAGQQGIDLKRVVYAGVPGPNLETRAEFHYFRSIGADVVGMSTVPEVLVARHMGLPVLGFSVVTNEGWRPERQPAPVEEVIAMAEKVAPKLERLVEAVLAGYFKADGDV